MLVPPTVLIGVDLIRSGQLSGTTRYFLPSLIALHVVVPLGLLDSFAAQRPLVRAVGKGVLVGLLAAGVVSCCLNVQAQTWWNKGVSFANYQVAEMINQTERPLVLAFPRATTLGNLISLSYRLKPETPIRVVESATALDLASWTGTMVLYRPSSELLTAARQAFSSEKGCYFDTCFFSSPEP